MSTVKSSLGDLLEHSLRFHFSAIINEAEYKVLLVGLQLEKRMGLFQ